MSRFHLLITAALLSAMSCTQAADWQSRIVSRWDGTGATGNGPSGMNLASDAAVMSTDGRVIAFDSGASNLIPGLPTIYSNVRNAYRRDRATGALTLVSHAAGAPDRPANGQSAAIALSADGRWLLLASLATDLVDGLVASKGVDLYVADGVSGAVDPVTVAPGSPGVLIGSSRALAISDDGDVVLFLNWSNNLVPGVQGTTDFTPGLYLRRRSTGSVRLVNHVAGDATRPALGLIGKALLSADGRTVVYSANASGQVAGMQDFNGTSDVFLYDADADTTTLVSHVPGDPLQSSTRPAKLVATDPAGTRVLFDRDDGGGLFDRGTGAVEALPAGVAAMSANGRFVAYGSTQPPAGVTDPSPASDAYLLDRSSGAVTLLSHIAGDPQTAANSTSVPLAIGADGRRVLFRSVATDLVQGQQDDGAGDDLFVYDQVVGRNVLVTGVAGSATLTSSRSVQLARLSAAGNVVVFTSAAADLLAETDLNEAVDAFAVDLVQGTREPLARAVVDRPAAVGANSMATSPDGRWVLYGAPAAGATTLTHTPIDAVYLADTDSGQRRLVSHRAGQPEQPAAADVYYGGAISDDGAFAAYAGYLTDQLTSAGSTNGLYLFDRAQGSNRLVTHLPGQPNMSAATLMVPSAIAFTPEGRYLAYASDAPDLVAGEVTRGFRQAYLYDRVADESFLLSGAAGSGSVAGFGDSVPAAVSADGRYVLFESSATDLVEGTQPTVENAYALYLRDRQTNTTRLVSHRVGEPNSPGFSAYATAMTSDGRFVLFYGTDPALTTTPDDNNANDVFVWDRDSDRTELVSRTPGADSHSGSRFSFPTAITDDGRFVLFNSAAADLPPTPNVAGVIQAYLADRSTGQRTLLTHGAAPGAPAIGGGVSEVLSRDGRCAVIQSVSSDLLPGDGLIGADLYRWCRDRPLSRITEPVPTVQGPTPSYSSYRTLAISADGARVLFTTNSGALDATTVDPNYRDDLLIARQQDELFRDSYE